MCFIRKNVLNYHPYVFYTKKCVELPSLSGIQTKNPTSTKWVEAGRQKNVLGRKIMHREVPV